MLSIAADLLQSVERAVATLAHVPQHAATAAPAPGTWSPLQVLGHLVDSAANNHQRFVRARWQDDLVFNGYDQERWGEAQAYASAPWSELLLLWAAYNRHLARVIDATPAAVRQRPHPRHDLAEIAWQRLPPDRPATLEWFMADYVGHRLHHLRQIDAMLGTASAGAD